jgi:hypothetical protein
MPEREVRTLSTVIHELPIDSTSQQVSDLIWAQVGLYSDPQTIRIKPNQTSATAFVTFCDADLVEFLNRNFDSVTLSEKPVRFEVKLTREEYRKALRVSSITFELP